MILKKIKVLVVDDSALVREILSRGLALDPEIEVVGVAADPFAARDKIIQLRPDVLTLDVEMPRMDGVEFLRRLMPQYPLPVIVVSALTRKGAATTLAALEAGAVDVVTKPGIDISRGLNAMLGDLRQKVKIAATANVGAWKANRRAPIPTGTGSRSLAESTDKVIAIGASTGGTEAIRKLLQSFPATIPGIVVVQHMPVGFTRHFAESLNNTCALEVREARTGDRVFPGRALIAPGDRHMRVHRSGGIYLVDCRPGEKVCGHCPSVEVLFQSLAKHVGANAIGIMLTGMGNDGAEGMLAMRQAGARTMAQDEATSVIFGMPRAAYEKGGAEYLIPLGKIPLTVKKALRCK
ncbi:MAG: chemotaxis response regulator protein-glutamate methylesterase [Peptococcaceae bacterium]|nr:chemotaxis response regulator protein-glutamate methylesterase [Peptococcaceae bacterium]